MLDTKALRPALFAGTLLAAALAAPAAQADWRGRGQGWGGPAPRYYAPPSYHHHRGYSGAPLLGAIIGLGAGVAIGTALAAPPPVYYAPPPPHYAPPPVYYAPPPPPGYYAPSPIWVPSKPGW